MAPRLPFDLPIGSLYYEPLDIQGGMTSEMLLRGLNISRLPESKQEKASEDKKKSAHPDNAPAPSKKKDG